MRRLLIFGIVFLMALPVANLISVMVVDDTEPVFNTTLEISLSNGESEIIEPIPKHGKDPSALLTEQRLLADLILEMQWVETAVVVVAWDESSASVQLGTIREPSSHEVDSIISILTSRLDGLEEENITITGDKMDVIYPR